MNTHLINKQRQNNKKQQHQYSSFIDLQWKVWRDLGVTDAADAPAASALCRELVEKPPTEKLMTKIKLG